VKANLILRVLLLSLVGLVLPVAAQDSPDASNALFSSNTTADQAATSGQAAPATGGDGFFHD
jgi:hypothetical protein